MAAEYVLQQAFSFCTNLTQMTFGPNMQDIRGMVMSYEFLKQVDLHIFAQKTTLASGLRYADKNRSMFR